MFGTGGIFGAVGGGLGGGGFPPRQVFEEQYHCYSVAYADKAHLEVREGTERGFCCREDHQAVVVVKRVSPVGRAFSL